MSGILKKTCYVTFVIVMSFLLQECGGHNTSIQDCGHKIEMRYASNLEMEEYDGYTIAKIRNPWDTTRTLHTYMLLERGASRPKGFSSATVIEVPLDKSVVYSVVHNSLIHELGREDAVSGVCDTEYVSESWLRKRLSSGKTLDCGSSMAPNVERILQISPDAVLLSPFENSNGYGKLGHAGIPIVECADYMETSPLGRAEWMKFYGRLYGRREKADSMFATTEREYLKIRELASSAEVRPKILLDRIYGQSWSVPGGKSTMGIMIEDAGGLNPFGDNNVLGSMQLSPEKVVMESGDADIWLIRFSKFPLTLSSMAADRQLYTKIKAYREGRVYGSDSMKSHIFDEVAFHPQWLLAEMAGIFHPEIEMPELSRNYFNILEN